MSSNPIIIIGGEPQSIFIELLLKAQKKINSTIILISSTYILRQNMRKFNHNFKFNELNKDLSNVKRNQINLLNIKYNKFSFSKKKITSDSNKFINDSFNKALEIIKKKKCLGLIN